MGPLLLRFHNTIETTVKRREEYCNYTGTLPTLFPQNYNHTKVLKEILFRIPNSRIIQQQGQSNENLLKLFHLEIGFDTLQTTAHQYSSFHDVTFQNRHNLYEML